MSKLEFPKIERYPVYAKIGVDYKDVKQDALINPDNGKVYSIVSKKYTILKHEEAYQMAKKLIEGLDWGESVEKVFFEANGARFWVKYRFDDMKINVPNDDSDYNPYLLIGNSYDKFKSFSIRLGVYRQACSNGLFLGEDVANVKRLHMPKPMMKGELNTVIKLIKKKAKIVVERNVELWKQWMKEKISRDEVEEMIEEMKYVPDKMKEEIIWRFSNEVATKFGLFMAVTYVISHMKYGRKYNISRQIDYENMFSKMFYGK